jgi:PIN domain nuclease of toxin-antitoxin system
VVSFLFDTHLLIWALNEPARLRPPVAAMLDDREADRIFSVIAIWETAIKAAAKRSNFTVDPHELRAALLTHGFRELPITADHVLVVRDLPLIHRDPFDRLLVAQAIFEDLTFVTADTALADHPGKVMLA